MRSSNPVFSTIERSDSYVVSEAASYRGIVVKTLFLFIIAAISGYYALTTATIETVGAMLIGAFIVALIAIIIATRSVRLALPFSIVFAAAEGVILGFVTVIAETFVPGAAMTAIIATASIFTVMLFLHSSRTIRVTPRFRRIMFSILLAILVFFIIFGLMSVFGFAFQIVSYELAIGISVFLIIFGALMLTLDFDRAEMIVESGADKRYEWMVSVGLMVTIIWIYIEILRLVILIAAHSRR